MHMSGSEVHEMTRSEPPMGRATVRVAWVDDRWGMAVGAVLAERRDPRLAARRAVAQPSGAPALTSNDGSGP